MEVERFESLMCFFIIYLFLHGQLGVGRFEFWIMDVSVGNTKCSSWVTRLLVNPKNHNHKLHICLK